MSTLTVWKFHSSGTADEVLGRLKDLQRQELIQIRDAAVVSWPEDKKKPKTRQLSDMTAAGGLGGAFWGLLFGLIFLVPIFGMLIGAAAGAVGGHFANVGIDDDFIKSVREKVTPGTSALFLLSEDAVVDRLKAAFEDVNAELISTNLSEEDEANLREVFAEED